jgi:hypothetical protein
MTPLGDVSVVLKLVPSANINSVKPRLSHHQKHPRASRSSHILTAILRMLYTWYLIRNVEVYFTSTTPQIAWPWGGEIISPILRKALRHASLQATLLSWVKAPIRLINQAMVSSYIYTYIYIWGSPESSSSFNFGYLAEDFGFAVFVTCDHIDKVSIVSMSIKYSVQFFSMWLLSIFRRRIFLFLTIQFFNLLIMEFWYCGEPNTLPM